MEISKAEGRYLTFSVAHEEYAVEVHRVREIIGPSAMEPAANAAPYIRGVIQLRGRTVPVLDLRRRFGLEEAEQRREDCIITVLVKGWEEPFLMGLLVEGIREVIQIWTENLEKAPAMEGDPREDFLLGLAQLEDRVVLLLDVDKLAKEEEVEEADLNMGDPKTISRITPMVEGITRKAV
jgi:purine-binding chemotaxis protein CheW